MAEKDMIFPEPPTHLWSGERNSKRPQWLIDAGRLWNHRLVPGLHVIRSESTQEDGSVWVHVSVARPDRLPSWQELNKVKTDFIGKDVEAYQVLAADQDHVNLHSYCLHLWAPVDGIRRVANLQSIKLEVAK